MGPKTLLAVAAAVTLGASLAACGSSSDNNSKTSSPASTTGAATTGARIALVPNKLGKIVVGPNGHTVYLFMKDTTNKSNCNGPCATPWMPVTTTGTPKAGPGLQQSLIGVTKRSDGTTQVTYNGHPIYYYDDDKKPGTTEGQNKDEFGAEWYVISAQGNKLE